MPADSSEVRELNLVDFKVVDFLIVESWVDVPMVRVVLLLLD